MNHRICIVVMIHAVGLQVLACKALKMTVSTSETRRALLPLHRRESCVDCTGLQGDDQTLSLTVGLQGDGQGVSRRYE